MEKTLITTETIEREIDVCKEAIDHFQSEYDKTFERTQFLTNRIEVLKVLDEKLKVGMAKSVNTKNMQTIADERFSLIPNLKGNENNVNYYKEMLTALEEMKKEY